MTRMDRNWDFDVVDRFIKPESQQKSPEVFRETHVPIDRIRAEILRPLPEHDEFVNEQQLKDAVLASDLQDDNRIFIVRGEVGSGKSHLCQWLEYEINGYGDDDGYEDEHVAIHISRSNTRLDEILEILHEPIDKEYEEVSDVSSLDPEEVADFIVQGLRTFYQAKGTLANFDLEAFLEPYERKDDFRSILVENVRNYQESVEQEGQEQDIQEYLLSREDYGKICFSAFGNTKREDDVYPFIRRAVHDLLTRNIGIEDFQGELEDLSEAYLEAGKRPVLICEDLTTFSVLKDDLLDHIFELSSGNYDIILGWTTGWQRENIDDALTTSEDSLTYMKQRTQGYLSMTDDQGQAYFLEGKSAPVVLVRQYLEAIKKHSEIEADVPEDAFDGLYPFNEPFIRHVFDSLVQNGNRQQTPRILLVHVISECLTSDVPPFAALQDNGYVRDRPFLISIDEHPDECLQLTQWYAARYEGRLWLPVEVFESFDVDAADAPVEQGIVFFDLSFAAGNVFIVERSPGEKLELELPEVESGLEVDSSTGTIEEAETGTETGNDEDEPAGGSESPLESPVPPEDYYEFQEWLRDGTEYESVGHFRDGIVATLERWHEPTRLANENATTSPAMGIYFARGSEPPVVVKGADTYSSMSFEVSHGTEHESLYRQMLQYGYTESFGDDANFDNLRGWADDKVVDYRRRMRNDIEGHLPAGMTVEEFIVLAQLLVINAGRGATETSPGLVFEEYHMEQSSPLHRTTNLGVNLPSGLEDAFDRLSNHTTEHRGLARGFFLLKKNVVDVDRLDEALEGVEENLDQYLRELGTVSVDDMAEAYSVGTTRSTAEKRLTTIIEDASDFAGELEELEQQVDLSKLRSEVEKYETLHSVDHNRQTLADVYETLKDSLGPLGINLRERWADAGELLDGDDSLGLEGFRETLEQVEGATGEDAISFVALLHEYQRSLDEHAAWEVYDVLTEMIEALEGVEGEEVADFREQVQDSEAFDRFRRKRDAVLQSAGGEV